MNKAIFGDLQGTLGGDVTGNIEMFEPYSFAREALQIAKNAGYLNLIVPIKAKSAKENFHAKPTIMLNPMFFTYFILLSTQSTVVLTSTKTIASVKSPNPI